MVLVVCLNPAIDVEWRVDKILREEKNSILETRRWAGGKGINVARWLQHLGIPARVLLPLGGSSGKRLRTLLRAENIPAAVIPISEATRENVVITEAGGAQFRFNQPGPRMNRRESQTIFSRFRQELAAGTTHVVLSGSIPLGFGQACYAEMIELARMHAIKAFVDCDGPVFAQAAIARPFLVKPNEFELQQWAASRHPGAIPTRQAAAELGGVTGGWVTVSRGPKGAWLFQGNEPALAAKAPRISVLNSLGAGDAFLAGLISGFVDNSTAADTLSVAVAAGTAAVGCAPGELPTRRRMAAMHRCVKVRRLPAARK